MINSDSTSEVQFKDPRVFSVNVNMSAPEINHCTQRYPCCIVWTPIPFITWILPFIGHMGIASSVGVIRDFAGSYFVSTDNMAFGKPTRYWQLDLNKVMGGKEAWDKAVWDACEIYKERTHNLILDNCHSHVATALNKMEYDNCNNWNMVKLCFLMFVHGKYVSFGAFCKSWIPFIVILCITITLICL